MGCDDPCHLNRLQNIFSLTRSVWQLNFVSERRPQLFQSHQQHSNCATSRFKNLDVIGLNEPIIMITPIADNDNGYADVRG